MKQKLLLQYEKLLLLIKCLIYLGAETKEFKHFFSTDLINIGLTNIFLTRKILESLKKIFKKDIIYKKTDFQTEKSKNYLNYLNNEQKRLLQNIIMFLDLNEIEDSLKKHYLSEENIYLSNLKMILHITERLKI